MVCNFSKISKKDRRKSLAQSCHDFEFSAKLALFLIG